MNFPFAKININSIQFETGMREVSLLCNIIEDEIIYKSELIVTHTDLNKIIGMLQEESLSNDIMSRLESIEIGDNHCLYTLNLAASSYENLWIENMDFYQHPVQIRA